MPPSSCVLNEGGDFCVFVSCSGVMVVCVTASFAEGGEVDCLSSCY